MSTRNQRLATISAFSRTRLGWVLPLRKLGLDVRQDAGLRRAPTGDLWRIVTNTAGRGVGGSWPTPHPTTSACSTSTGPCAPDRTAPGDHRMPAVKDVGEPCAGKPHVRNRREGAGNGTLTRHRAAPYPTSPRSVAAPPGSCNPPKARLKSHCSAERTSVASRRCTIGRLSRSGSRTNGISRTEERTPLRSPI